MVEYVGIFASDLNLKDCLFVIVIVLVIGRKEGGGKVWDEGWFAFMESLNS